MQERSGESASMRQLEEGEIDLGVTNRLKIAITFPIALLSFAIKNFDSPERI